RVLPARSRAQSALFGPVGARSPERASGMKRLVLLLSLAVALLAPVAAQAHPLGNFTVNRFARVEVSGHRLYIRYVLDLAEIPTFQAKQRGIDAGAYSARLARGLHIALDGRSVPLVPVAHALAF